MGESSEGAICANHTCDNHTSLGRWLSEQVPKSRSTPAIMKRFVGAALTASLLFGALVEPGE